MNQPSFIRQKLLISVGVIAAAPFVLFALYYLFVIWQFHKAWLYNGDGTAYQGNSPSVLMTIRVGKVDLSHAGVVRFSLSHIPYDDVWIGFELPSPAAPTPNAYISLTLTNGDGQLVMQETGALSSWKQSNREYVLGTSSKVVESCVLRRDGAGREIPVDADGDTRYEQLGLRADGGWGTHFSPRFTAKYVLEVKVDRPDSKYSQPVTLLVQAEPTMFAP